jgi:hypothetical protein
VGAAAEPVPGRAHTGPPPRGRGHDHGPGGGHGGLHRPPEAARKGRPVLQWHGPGLASSFTALLKQPAFSVDSKPPERLMVGSDSKPLEKFVVGSDSKPLEKFVVGSEPRLVTTNSN